MKELLGNNQNNKDNWIKNKKSYEQNKRNIIDWSKIKKQKRITNEKVKENDIYYNPILQKYNSISLDTNIKQKENNEIINSIIKSKDYQLSKEQTYNLISLEDKLKGFENHPNYPKQKDIIKSRKKIIYHPKDFNILSNLPFNIHHYDKPENRPKVICKSESPKYKTITNSSHYKDYDIISTNYKNFNNEKRTIDKQINKIHTARIFYKKNNYNPIKGVYFNKEKEEEFQKKNLERQLTWGQDKIKNMPKCAKGKSDVYNLITTHIVDPVEMDRLLKEEKDKKQRYEIRYQLEKFYRDRSLNKISQDEIRYNNKVSSERYKIEDQRQYNIINLKDKPYKEHEKNIKKGYQTIWETILSGGNDNNTFDKKEIYKDPYDYSEIGKLYYEYKIRRNNTLSRLKKIEDDQLFNNRKKYLSKINLRKNINIKQFNKDICKTSEGFMDKSKFFAKK